MLSTEDARACVASGRRKEVRRGGNSLPREPLKDQNPRDRIDARPSYQDGNDPKGPAGARTTEAVQGLTRASQSCSTRP